MSTNIKSINKLSHKIVYKRLNKDYFKLKSKQKVILTKIKHYEVYSDRN